MIHINLIDADEVHSGVNARKAFWTGMSAAGCGDTGTDGRMPL